MMIQLKNVVQESKEVNREDIKNNSKITVLPLPKGSSKTIECEVVVADSSRVQKVKNICKKVLVIIGKSAMAAIKLPKKFVNLILKGEVPQKPEDYPDLDRVQLNLGKIKLNDGEEIIDFTAAERFRILRAKIERRNLHERKYQVIAITSAVPEEGKSLVAANLARALSLDPMGKTIIVDCDLRRPSVQSYFGVPLTPGIGVNGVGAHDYSRKIIRTVSNRLDMITAGEMVEDPALTIEHPSFGEFIEKLKKHYRYVILDCPPSLLCPEPITISSNIADTTLLVARAWQTEKRLVRDAVEVIGKERLLGIVLNDANESSRQYSTYGYYGYNSNYITKAQERVLNRANQK